MSDEPKEVVRLLHPPKTARWAPNPQLGDYLLRLADQAADGHLGQIVICYRKEDGFGHFISAPIGAEETLAMVGMLDYVREIVRARITST